jgi:type IV pilus assembly protein PilA
MSTTTHPFTPEEIMAFVDGELSTDCAQSLSTHIDQCAECTVLAIELRGLSRQMPSWEVEIVPDSLGGQVTGAARKKRTKTNPLFDSLLNQRHSPALRLVIEIACGFAVIVLLMAIAVPNLLRSRMAANEASAVGSLRTLNTAAATYLGSYGHYPPSLRSFGLSSSGIPSEEGAGLIDDTVARGGPKSGYLFTYHRTPAEGRDSRGGYRVNADSTKQGTTGIRHFSTDQTGTIFADGVDLGGSSMEAKSSELDKGVSTVRETPRHPFESTPMIARTADLKLLVERLDDARQAMDRILTQHKGYVAELSATAESGSARVVVASLRVPADQLDVCLAELKKLGRVTQESQAGEEVTKQHLDLVARLKNSRNTEARLNGVLQQRTGPIKEILDVEKESARVRGEIEQMESEQKNLEHRVNFATIDLKLAEEYKAQLTTPALSVAMQLRNAIVDGFRSAFQSLLALVLFLAECGPTLLLWLIILSLPAWLLWRRYQRSLAMGSSLGV